MGMIRWHTGTSDTGQNSSGGGTTVADVQGF
jgi:hypothetical protein